MASYSYFFYMFWFIWLINLFVCLFVDRICFLLKTLFPTPKPEKKNWSSEKAQQTKRIFGYFCTVRRWARICLNVKIDFHTPYDRRHKKPTEINRWASKKRVSEWASEWKTRFIHHMNFFLLSAIKSVHTSAVQHYIVVRLWSRALHFSLSFILCVFYSFSFVGVVGVRL